MKLQHFGFESAYVAVGVPECGCMSAVDLCVPGFVLVCAGG